MRWISFSIVLMGSPNGGRRAHQREDGREEEKGKRQNGKRVREEEGEKERRKGEESAVRG